MCALRRSVLSGRRSDLAAERFFGSRSRTVFSCRTFDTFPVDPPAPNQLLLVILRRLSKEQEMRALVWRAVAALLVTLSVAGAAHAQGSFFTSLSGTVVDTSGGVIPGAD